MDTTFNEEIIINFDSTNQTAQVTALKTFNDLAIHLQSSGTFKTTGITQNPGTSNFYDKNTISLSGVFSDYILYKKILEFLDLRKLKIFSEDPAQDSMNKTTTISLVLSNLTFHKP